MRVWLSRYWRLVLIIGVVITGLLISLVGYSAINVYRDSKSLLITLKSSNEVSATQSSKLVADINKSFGILKLPVIKQLTQITGLDFTPIQSEITTLARLSPILLGDNKPKQYLVAFQNTAEARGPGGILGAYALIEINNGDIKILKTGSNAALQSNKEIPIKMPDEFMRIYGKNPAIWQNSNLSPHFPYGAQIWMASWQKQYGGKLDGVIGIDPTAISYILKATGDVKLASGEEITADNVVFKTLSQAYKKYEKDNDARKQYLVDIMNATFAKLMANQFNKIKMAQAVKRAIIENRLLVYTTDKDAQAEIEKVRVGGALQTVANNEYRVVIQNIDASKLDYYLDRSVKVESTECKVNKQALVTVTVTNTVQNANDLPDYVLTRADKGKPADLKTGQHRFKVFIYGPVDAKLGTVSRSTPGVELGGGGVERKRPIYITDVDLAPNQSEIVTANFTGGVGKITYVDQPLVRKTILQIKDRC
jgi:uncharacterized protein Usg